MRKETSPLQVSSEYCMYYH